jgi:hypothetical protein
MVERNDESKPFTFNLIYFIILFFVMTWVGNPAHKLPLEAITHSAGTR